MRSSLRTVTRTGVRRLPHDLVTGSVPGGVGSAAVPRPRAYVPNALLPLALLLAPQARVGARRDRPKLTLKLEPALMPLVRQRARVQRLLHRAVRLGLVRAIREPALEHELLD